MSRQVKEGNTKGRENKRGGEKRESTVYGNGQGNKRVMGGKCLSSKQNMILRSSSLLAPVNTFSH